MSEPLHAKYSPSGAPRWMNCIASLALGVYAPPQEDDGDSPASVEGTAAHALAAYCLTEDIEPYMLIGMEWEKIPDYPNEAIKKVGIEEELKEKRQQTIEDITHFVDHCSGLKEKVASGSTYSGIEDKVQATSLSDKCYGTADFWLYHCAEKTLHIVDYKNGFIPVAADSEQLKIYAAATAETHKLKPDKYVLTVVQPNGPGEIVKTAELDDQDMRNFLYQAQSAIDVHETAPLQEAVPGKWCKWCKAKSICHKYKATVEQDTGVPTDGFSDDDLLRANSRIPAIKEWISHIQKVTFARLMQGAAPLAVGAMLNASSPNRKYHKALKEGDVMVTLEDALKKELGDKAFTKPGPISPAQLEKLPGGKAIAMKWSYRPPGSLSLADLSSKKPHVTPPSTKERLTNIANS